MNSGGIFRCILEVVFKQAYVVVSKTTNEDVTGELTILGADGLLELARWISESEGNGGARGLTNISFL